jgi:hypothetical protein
MHAGLLAAGDWGAATPPRKAKYTQTILIIKVFREPRGRQLLTTDRVMAI